MKHFKNFDNEQLSSYFYQMPEELTLDSEKDLLSIALGATLYMPSTRNNLRDDVIKMHSKGVTSLVICLEDSIADSDVEKGLKNIREQLPLIAQISEEERPLIFVRVRTPEQVLTVAGFSNSDVLCGFVFPKFGDINMNANSDTMRYLHNLRSVNQELESDSLKPFYFMPVLETPELVHAETRSEFLKSTKALLDSPAYNDYVLAVRIGATDLSSVYGMRRSRDMVIYDSGIISQAIYDLVNVFTRYEDGYNVTGPVWEHFSNVKNRLFKPSLRQTIFSKDNRENVRSWIIKNDFDKFIEEIRKDRTNNICGKTVIHPSHVSIVNSMLAVTYEDYMDALAISNSDARTTGAVASASRNKMNEQKPHTPWANKLLRRAKVYGVLKSEHDPIDLVIESFKNV